MDTPRDPTSVESIEAALKPFGWTMGDEFWERYHSDAWVFNLANAACRLGERLAAAEAERDDLHRQLTITKLREHQLQVDLAAAEREGVENCIVVASRRLAHDPVWPTLRAELAALSPLPDTETPT